jgi:trans-2,3-dihydro-3-hydroxyanthranilate isomerase
MDQSPPVFGDTVEDHPALAKALGLSADDLADRAQVVSTGAGHLLVPVRDRATVDAAAPEPAPLMSILRAVGGEGCYVYSRDPVDPGDAVAYARFFNPTMGSPRTRRPGPRQAPWWPDW